MENQSFHTIDCLSSVCKEAKGKSPRVNKTKAKFAGKHTLAWAFQFKEPETSLARVNTQVSAEGRFRLLFLAMPLFCGHPDVPCSGMRKITKEAKKKPPANTEAREAPTRKPRKP